jgi:hypothetical protein
LITDQETSMKTLALSLAAVASLLSPAAFAGELTGTVHTYCMNGASSCRATLDLADGKSVNLEGDFAKLGKLDGKIATVTGTKDAVCPGGGTCDNFTVTGVKGFSSSAADKKLGTALSNKLSDNGVITLKSGTTWTPTAQAGVFEASGKVNENSLWGGLDADYGFTVDMDVATGAITNLHVADGSTDAGSNVARDASSNATAGAAPTTSAGAGVNRH